MVAPRRGARDVSLTVHPALACMVSAVSGDEAMTRALGFLVVLAGLLLAGASAWAAGQTVAGQSATTSTGQAAAAPASLDRMIEAAKADGYSVVVINPATPAAAAPAATPMMMTAAMMDDRMMTLREKLGWIVAGLPALPGAFVAFLDHHAGGMGTAWPLYLVALAAVFLAAGYGVERWYGRWAEAQLADTFHEAPEDRSDKIAFLLTRALAEAVGVVIQGVVAVALVVAADVGEGPGRATGLTTVAAVILARLVDVLLRALIAPDRGDCRLLRLDDKAARHLLAVLRTVTRTAVAIAMFCAWLVWLGLDLRANVSVLMIATSVIALLSGAVVVATRGVVAGVILGPPQPGGAPRPLALRLLARTWHVLAIIYLTGAWAISVYRLALGMPNAVGLVLAPVLIGIVGLVLYGVVLLVIDRMFRRRRPAAEAPPGHGPAGRRTMRDLMDHAAGLLVGVAMIWALSALWGVDVLAGTGAAGAAVDVLMVVFLAYVAFQAVKIAVDNRIAEEIGIPDPEAEMPEEGGGAGASRLATLLPIFRNFLLAVIVSIAGMVVLSELGVDIAPLFAGAGVVGLAVGFGAQTLIRDIFSGAFFLLDDAFRKGEYVDIGGTKGTVERISMRSMQLRHQLGPLHTIPFGEIKRLTNYSRDWVMMKLPLRVPYDTDVEQVRKIIKKLGAELLAHPEVGAKFLEPLKSQGVYTMEDSAMIVRVKFMTRPGDQFQVRKLVYQRIRELFEEAGIRFAHREVTVRLAGEPMERPLTERERQAMAGAVLPVIEAEASAGSPDAR